MKREFILTPYVRNTTFRIWGYSGVLLIRNLISVTGRVWSISLCGCLSTRKMESVPELPLGVWSELKELCLCVAVAWHLVLHKG